MPPTLSQTQSINWDQIRRSNFRESGQILTYRSDYEVT